VPRELLGVDARERAKRLGLRRREPRQLEGEGQHELPKRHGGQDAVDEYACALATGTPT
jgi:hypothetical protein